MAKPAAAQGAIEPVTFIDQAFKSRLLFPPSGNTLSVEKSRITVSDPGDVEWLSGQGEFQREDASA